MISVTVHELIAEDRPPSISQISASLGRAMRLTQPIERPQRGIRSSGKLTKRGRYAPGGARSPSAQRLRTCAVRGGLRGTWVGKSVTNRKRE